MSDGSTIKKDNRMKTGFAFYEKTVFRQSRHWRDENNQNMDT